MLNKSFLTPPSMIFSIVWFILYVLIGISFAIYLIKGFFKDKTFGSSLFLFQMMLNLSWPFVFFKLHNVQLAFYIILTLILCVLVLIFIFYKVSKLASYLLIPYFLWVVFACYLNYEIIKLNDFNNF